MAGVDPGDETTTIYTWNFGSAHVTGFNVVMCDGSVRQVSYSVSKMVHHCLANRCDHQPIDPAQIP
jgi:prepilin-type processing-associated H-X9-DG protein